MNKFAVYLLAGMLFLVGFFFEEYPKLREFSDDALHIYFLDVGQGDSTLIKLPSRKLILVDGGPNRDVVNHISDKVPFYIDRIDLMVVSHSHADHITGLSEVLDHYEVGCIVYDWQDSEISETEEQFRRLIEGEGIQVVSTVNEISESCFSDSDVQVGFYSLRKLGVLEEYDYRDNQNLESNLMLLKYNEFEALFTGDAETPVQEALIPQISGDIEVVKVPHQGASDSYYPPLGSKLLPDLAVISVGGNNAFGHPHSEVLNGYESMDIQVGRTDLNGTVEVMAKDSKWKFILEKP